MTTRKMPITLLFGLVAALCMICFVAGTWLAGPEAFNGSTVWLGRCIVLLIAAIAATMEKRARGGAIDFRSALKVAYGVLVLAILAQSLMIWLIPNVIDPHFNQRLIPVMLADAERRYRQFGGNDPQGLQAVLNDIRTNNQFSLGRVISGTGFQLVLFFIIALLIAVTVKLKKPPTPAHRQ